MEALLVYNPNAGGGAENQAEIFRKELAELGYSPIYKATKNEDDLNSILPDAKGIVVVVGGDGTLRAVCTRLIDRDLPIALIPNGTANNVGRTLGIQGEPLEVLKSLTNADRVKVDLGVMSSRWGETYFLEGAGMGLFAEALNHYKPEDGKSFLRGCKTLVELLTNTPKRKLRLRIDGREESGEYLLLEAMNMGAIGPRIALSPQADPGDGLMEIIRIEEKDRDSYLTYLTALIQGELAELDSVVVTPAKKLEILWDGSPIHQDASCMKFESIDHLSEEVWLTIELKQKCLEFLVPKTVA